MAARWSNPSGGAGFQRFRVWPAGSDSYSYSDLAGNWDGLDAILGNNPSANWPPTTGLNGGIYREVALLQANQLEPGHFFHFFRPNSSVSIPAYAHICDGSTLDASQHDFPGGGSVTLPDLINRFVIGADITKTIGAAGANPTDGSINADAGAPGPQGVGGQNAHALNQTEVPNVISVVDGQAMVGTHQSWPSIGPDYGTFVQSVTVAGSVGVNHENRPLFVGLIPCVVVKLVNTL